MRLPVAIILASLHQNQHVHRPHGNSWCKLIGVEHNCNPDINHQPDNKVVGSLDGHPSDGLHNVSKTKLVTWLQVCRGLNKLSKVGQSLGLLLGDFEVPSSIRVSVESNVGRITS